MLKIFKTQIILAVCFLVSMSVVFANDDIANLDNKNNNVITEEKWRFPIGSKNVRYVTKYTIILNEEKHEYYLNYKEVVTEKFKGYYWGMKENDLEKDDNYIYTKDKIKFTREDVIKFLEIKDEKLVAMIKEGCEFSLYLEPCFSYKKGKWSDTYTSTLREIYAMLPEAKGEIEAYENAKDDSGNIIKRKIQGIEFLRETIVNSMNVLISENLEKYQTFMNEYKDSIKQPMLNKGFIGYYFKREEVTTGEFIKMITNTLWPNFKYLEPAEGVHWAKPYADALDRKVLMSVDYNNERLDRVITRKEAARLLCLFYISYNSKYGLNNTYEYINNFKDESLIEEEIERICVDDAVRFGLMKEYEDGTFRPNDGLTKKEAEEIFKIAISN